jgi:quercetin dioxygenase-like cupin family protein
VEESEETRATTAEAVWVPAGEDVDGERRGLGISVISFKVTPRDGLDLLVLENRFQAPGGPPRHLHEEQEEIFYALEGQFLIEIGDERRTLGPGDAVLAPRQVPHVWASVGDAGRILITFSPAGQMGAFFREVTRQDAMPGQDPDLWRRHGMRIVGPPLELG